MLRMLNVPELLSQIGLPEGTLLPVEDPDFEDNSGQWRVESGGDVVHAGTVGAEALPVGLATALLLEGRLGARGAGLTPFEPLLGNPEFRVLDAF